MKAFRLLFLLSVLVGLNACVTSNKRLKGQRYISSLKIEGVKQETNNKLYALIPPELKANSKFGLFLGNIFKSKGRSFVGQDPSLLDSALIKVVDFRLKQYLKNDGYLNARTAFEVDYIKKHAARLTFKVDTLSRYRYNDIDIVCQNDTFIEEILSAKVIHRFIKKNDYFNYDSLALLRRAITEFGHDHGYYDLSPKHITFAVDSNKMKGNMLKVNVVITSKDTLPVTNQYRVRNTNIRVLKRKGDETDEPKDSLRFKDSYSLLTPKKLFKPKHFYQTVYLYDNELYSESNAFLTTQRLLGTSLFKEVRSNFEKVGENKLDWNIDAVLRPTYSINNNLEFYFSNNAEFGINANVGLLSRNLFKKAEVTEFKINYGIMIDNNETQNKLLNRVVSAEFALRFPYLISPFKRFRLGKYGLPVTTFRARFENTAEPGKFIRNYFSAELQYDWWETQNTLHRISPLALELYINNTAPEFKELIQDTYRYLVYTLNKYFLISGIKYNFTYNPTKLYAHDKSFFFFRGEFETAGNFFYLLSKVSNAKPADFEDFTYDVFNVPYMQFIRLSTDLRRYFVFDPARTLVARFFAGISLPYGNSSFHIREKKFSSGGSNSLRGWRIRSLGPGSASNDIFSDENFELKLEANVEYRFNIYNLYKYNAQFKGALFADVGNVWNLRRYDFTDNADINREFNDLGTFDSKNFSKQIAASIGFGLRIHLLNNLVVRLDLAFKLKDPQFGSPLFSDTSQWVFGKWIDNRFKDDYRRKTGNKYGFFQFNFDLGLPF